MYLSKKFICASKDYCTEDCHVPAPYFRRSFRLERRCDRVEITICGLGLYRLYINGKELTKGCMASYLYNPDDVIFYDRYDITEYMRRGDNIIGVLLGNGFLNSPDAGIWQFTEAPFRSAPKLALALEADGTLIFEADELFVTHPSPITFDAYRYGEHYDARLETHCWNVAKYDDSKWAHALSAVTPKGEALLNDADTVRYLDEMPPVRIWRCDKGYVYDFGKNFTGVCRLKIKGESGQKIRLTYSELLRNGVPTTENIVFEGRSKTEYVQVDEYICKGEGEENHLPSFTYHGFRFVLVEGINETQAVESLLTYVVMHSDVARRGEFFCSSGVLNLVQECVGYSDLSNLFYFPTDCPQREKNGWTGDAALSSEQFLYNFKMERTLKQWLVTVRKSQNDKGALPGIVPTGGWGFEWGNGPSWDMVLFEMPLRLYQFSADKSVISDNAQAMNKYLRYMAGKRNDDGVTRYGLGDWCMAGANSEGNFQAPIEVTDTATCFYIATIAAKMLKIVGDEGAEYAEQLAKELRESFRKKFWDKKNFTVESRCQTAQAATIFYGLLDQEEIEPAVKVLVDIIREDGEGMKVGIVGGRAIFRVLSENGYADLAYKMVTRDEFPSYKYNIALGFNTLTEAFNELNGNMRDGFTRKDGSRWLMSYNHHMWGDISCWMFEYVAGLNYNRNAEDVYSCTISPKFIKELTFASAELKTIAGTIFVKWQRSGDGIELYVTAPQSINLVYELDKNEKVRIVETEC